MLVKTSHTYVILTYINTIKCTRSIEQRNIENTLKSSEQREDQNIKNTIEENTIIDQVDYF